MEKEKELIEKIKNEVTDLLKEKGLSIEDINNKINAMQNVEDFKKLKSEFENVQAELTVLKNKGISQEPIGKQYFTAFEKLKTEIERVKFQKSGMVEILKMKTDNTPNILTTSVTAVTTGGNGLFEMIHSDDIAMLRLRESVIETYATRGTISIPMFTYTDTLPIHDPSDKGFATVVAEGSAKPKISIKWENRMEYPVKVAAHEILSDEAEIDIPQLSMFANDALRKRTILARNSNIVTYVKTTAAAYDPTSWADASVVNPNLIDAIIAAAIQITNASSWADDIQFMPNIAFVNYQDYLALSTVKDKEEGYLWAESIDQKMRIRIIPVHKNDVPKGSILVGDFTKLEVYDYVPYEVKMGYINAQMIENMFTMVGETRFVKVIRQYNKKAFVYDTVANITTAIAGS
jgi:HK97 family phage major capsid protein